MKTNMVRVFSNNAFQFHERVTLDRSSVWLFDGRAGAVCFGWSLADGTCQAAGEWRGAVIHPDDLAELRDEAATIEDVAARVKREWDERRALAAGKLKPVTEPEAP